MQFQIKQMGPAWLPFLGYADIKGIEGYDKAFAFQWLNFGFIFWLRGPKVEQ